METAERYEIVPIGRVHSTLRHRADAPKQGWEGAPDARLEIFPEYVTALDGITAGSEIVVLTWLHEGERDVLKVRPRDDASRPLTGVFATRSSNRPNPVGLHPVIVLGMTDDGWLDVRGLEAIDGTPVIDIKPVFNPPAG